MLRQGTFIIAILGVAACCIAGADRLDTSQLPDRWFIAPEVWPNPWENWQIRDGAIVTSHASPHRPMTLHLLTHELTDQSAAASMSVVVRREGSAKEQGAAGFVVGIKMNDPIDDYRSRLLFGEGLYMGLDTKGNLFIGPDTRKALELPAGGAFTGPVRLSVEMRPVRGERFAVVLTATNGEAGKVLGKVEAKGIEPGQLAGNVALVAGAPKTIVPGPQKARWAFTDWQFGGPKFAAHPEHAFGPILWSQYTLSKGIVKLTAQMAPIGEQDSPRVDLEMRRHGQWQRIASTFITPLSWTAHFRLENWDDSVDVPYRLLWTQRFADGAEQTHKWEGVIRKDPVEQDQVSAAVFCCFMDYLFPNRCVAQNVARQDPDLLAFTGDQIYEPAGGWGILRTGPLDRMCVNYLRKLALWGWSFRDVMKDRPTVVMPDDHDVYQGNIWGDAGREIELKEWNAKSGYGNSQNVGSVGGYVQPIEFVKAVERTQTAHLPDPACTKTFKQGLGAYFTSMNYGGIGFAILEDRKFKTGPQQISAVHAGPRPDHISEPNMADVVNDPNAKLLGDDQLAFLREWVGDWRGQAMKAAISQTTYCGVATHHGSADNYLLGDMDSGGWPQAGRRKAIDALRRGGVVLLAGDQHLPTIVRQGLDQFGDGIVSYVVPAGATGYQRWWRPEEMGMKRAQGGRHDNRTNTGCYRDGFGNLIDVLAVGNPPLSHAGSPNRETTGKNKSAGWGFVIFNKPENTIRMEAWRVRPGLNVAKSPREDDQFPGWPLTMDAAENYGITALKLPPITRAELGDDAGERPIIRVTDADGQVVCAGRMTGGSFTPTVYAPAEYTVDVVSDLDDTTVVKRQAGVEPVNR